MRRRERSAEREEASKKQKAKKGGKQKVLLIRGSAQGAIQRQPESQRSGSRISSKNLPTLAAHAPPSSQPANKESKESQEQKPHPT